MADTLSYHLQFTRMDADTIIWKMGWKSCRSARIGSSLTRMEKNTARQSPRKVLIRPSLHQRSATPRLRRNTLMLKRLACYRRLPSSLQMIEKSGFMSAWAFIGSGGERKDFKYGMFGRVNALKNTTRPTSGKRGRVLIVHIPENQSPSLRFTRWRKRMDGTVPRTANLRPSLLNEKN